MGLSNVLSCEAGSFSCCCLNPTGVFSQRFEALFPCAGALGCVVCYSPQLFLPVYPHPYMGLPSPPGTASPAQSSSHSCHTSSLPQLPVSTPPTSLDEWFFNSLVVRLTYSLIFWQFWLFFVFKFVVVLLLVVQGGKVYLPTPPSWPEVSQ